MIADNEPYVREGLEKLIDWQDLGCEIVFSASNGKELIEEMQRVIPQIIITDIKMPVMDGIEVAQCVYENYENTDVIFLTDLTDFSYAQLAIHYGVSDYIIKKYTLEKIPEAVRKIQRKRDNKVLSNII